MHEDTYMASVERPAAWTESMTWEIFTLTVKWLAILSPVIVGTMWLTSL
jgi:hypothetical protein